MKLLGMLFMVMLFTALATSEASAQTLGNVFSNIEGGSLITWVIGIIATVFGGTWTLLKTKGLLVAKLAKESVDVIEEINKSLADDALSKKEIENIRKELKDVQIAWKVLIKKKDQK